MSADIIRFAKPGAPQSEVDTRAHVMVMICSHVIFDIPVDPEHMDQQMVVWPSNDEVKAVRAALRLALRELDRKVAR